MGTSYTFRNGVGVMKIPVRAVTPTIAGAWVGEGSPKPVKRASFSTISLSPTKLVGDLALFPKRWRLYGLPSIEGIIRQAMADDTGIALDTYLIDNVAASAGVRPAGLLNGVTPITAIGGNPGIGGDGGGSQGAGRGDHRGRRRRPGPCDRVAGQSGAGTVARSWRRPRPAISCLRSGQAASRFGMRLIVSATVPAGRVIAIDAADFATARGDVPRFAVSTEATLHEEDTTPLALVTGAQGSGLWRRRCGRCSKRTPSRLECSMYVTWAMRRAGMVQTIAAVTLVMSTQ